MLGEGDEAASERRQYLVIYFDNGSFSLGDGAFFEGLAANLVEGLAEFVLVGGFACGSFGRGTDGCGAIIFCRGSVS